MIFNDATMAGISKVSKYYFDMCKVKCKESEFVGVTIDTLSNITDGISKIGVKRNGRLKVVEVFILFDEVMKKYGYLKNIDIDVFSYIGFLQSLLSEISSDEI